MNLKLKLTGLLILICTSFCFAKKPIKMTPGDMTKHISRDIVLTDSQKIVLTRLTKECENKWAQNEIEKDSTKRKTKKKEIIMQYHKSFMSLLTQAQKDSISSKLRSRAISRTHK